MAAPDPLPPLLQHVGKALCLGDAPFGRPVHDHVAMAFEQAHEPADTVERLSLFRRGEQSHKAAFVQWVLAFSGFSSGPLQCLDQPPRVRIHALEQSAHEVQEIWPQPGHSRELCPVGDFMERDPEPELVRLEAVTVFELDHVVADVVDDVLVVRGLVFDQKLVVLAEDPRRHPS